MVYDGTAYEGPDKPVSIYALIDPRDSTVRYVGATGNLKSRVSAHKSGTACGSEKNAAWMQELAAEGVSPKVAVLDKADEDEWQAAERKWIRRWGGPKRLNNSGPGNKDGAGRACKPAPVATFTVHTDEATAERIKARAAALSKEHGFRIQPSKWISRAIRLTLERDEAEEAARSQLGEE